MDSLLDVLLDARSLAAGDPDLVAEIDGYLGRLRENPSVGGLFLPTGHLQDHAIDAGRGDEFLAVADRYDALS